ncbi:MAG: hypothetical protein ABI759_06835 [Candidatus Solibacter sp.]
MARLARAYARARTKQQRYVLLTLSGYVFYGYWNWKYCLLLLFSSLISFLVALRLVAAESQANRRFWLILSVAADLTILFFFKYYNFIAQNVRAAIPGAPLPLIDVVLPIGISFYTFHTISYIVDVARGRILPTRNLWEYLAYVSLFSQLVAGPIVRFRQIEDDLETIDGPPKEDWLARGIAFFVIGEEDIDRRSDCQPGQSPDRKPAGDFVRGRLGRGPRIHLPALLRL